MKEKMGGLGACVCELVIGILLLINPVGFTRGIIMAFGAAVTVLGAVNVVQYIRTEPHAASREQRLSKGLVMVLLGLFCLLKAEWFIVTFPLLTMVYGVLILLMGIEKVQWTLDMLRAHKPYWYLMGVSAVLSLVFAWVVLADPFASTAALWVFVGVSLIVEAVADLLAALFTGRTYKVK